jgi:hypothetical protein
VSASAPTGVAGWFLTAPRHPAEAWLVASASFDGTVHRVKITSASPTGEASLAPLPFPGFALSVAARPLALVRSASDPLAPLGARLDFRLGFPSAKFQEGPVDVRIPNGWLEAGLGVFYRLLLMSDRLVVAPRVDLMLHRAAVRDGETRSLETLSFPTLRAGADAAFEVVDHIWLEAGAGFRLGLGVGKQAHPFYGAAGSGVSKLGFDARVGAGWQLRRALRVGLSLGVTYYRAGFNGTGTSGLDDAVAHDAAYDLTLGVTYFSAKGP